MTRYKFIIVFVALLPLTMLAQSPLVRLADKVVEYALSAEYSGLRVNGQGSRGVGQLEMPIVSINGQGLTAISLGEVPEVAVNGQGLRVISLEGVLEVAVNGQESKVKSFEEFGLPEVAIYSSSRERSPSNEKNFLSGRSGRNTTVPLQTGVLQQNRYTLPERGVDNDYAMLVMSEMVYDGIMDGSVSAKDEKWRPYLASITSGITTRGSNSEVAFDLLLAGCVGSDIHSRMRVAENWARRHDGGRYLPAVAIASAKKYFNSGDYKMAIEKCNIVASSVDGERQTANGEEYAEKGRVYKLAFDSLLLRVLCEVNLGDRKKARETLSGLRNWELPPNELAEVSYMEAWILLNENKTKAAAEILRGIVRDYSQSPAATKAKKILEALK